MAGKGNLGPRLERYVTDLVETGRYQSRSEVLQEGVRLVEERENRLVALDDAINGAGHADAQAGGSGRSMRSNARADGPISGLAAKSDP